MPVEDVVRRRRDERASLLASAEGFAAGLPEELDVRAVVVFGSVARGDFNVWSDVDVLVVADEAPERVLDRFDAVGPRPPKVQPIVWTSDEFRHRWERSDPIAVEAITSGVWLRGSADALTT